MMQGFILVHTPDMKQVLVNISDITYVEDVEGAAQVMLRPASEATVILCHETLQEVYRLIYDELGERYDAFWSAKR